MYLARLLLCVTRTEQAGVGAIWRLASNALVEVSYFCQFQHVGVDVAELGDVAVGVLFPQSLAYDAYDCLPCSPVLVAETLDQVRLELDLDGVGTAAVFQSDGMRRH